MTMELPADFKTTLRRIIKQMAILDRRTGSSAANGNPPGVLQPFAGTTPPMGWLMCDGGAVSRETFAALFAQIGTRYGAGNGTTTFNIPNLMGQTIVGYDPSQVEFNAIGKTGGSKTETLTEAQLASHTHAQSPHNHTQNAHTHTQNSHNHGQNAHNHGQNAHTHVQDSHNHTQNAHNHTQNAHGHNLDAGSRLVRDGSGTFANVDASGGSYALGTIASNTATNNATTATNQAAVATNQSTTAVNQAATAVNQAATATNQDTTATNNATTAVNQNAGGGQAHNNLQPFTAMPYIIKT